MPFECYGWCRAQIEDERADEHFPTFRGVPALRRGRKDMPWQTPASERQLRGQNRPYREAGPVLAAG
jgi:hypothetical protein